MLRRISGARMLTYLGESNVVFSPKIILDNMGGSIAYLTVGKKFEIIGILKSPIFHEDHRKIMKIFEKLFLLVKKIYPVIPQGKLKFEVVEEEEKKSRVIISFFSKKKEIAFFGMLFDYDAFQSAELFLQIMAIPQVA
jgi:hypothetical protein